MKIETDDYSGSIEMDDGVVTFSFTMKSGEVSGSLTIDDLLLATNRLSHELQETFGVEFEGEEEDSMNRTVDLIREVFGSLRGSEDNEEEEIDGEARCWPQPNLVKDE